MSFFLSLSLNFLKRKGQIEMAVFRVDKTKDYTVMANHHLRNTKLSLKAKGLLSLMLSLPENWDYTIKGLASICKDGIDSINATIKELESEGYIKRSRVRNAKGQLTTTEYVIYEQPHFDEDNHNGKSIVAEKAENSANADIASSEPKRENPILDSSDTDLPVWENPILGNPILGKPILGKPILENPDQLNTNILSTNKLNTKESNTNYSSFIHSTESIDSKVKNEGMNDYEEICKRIDFEKLIRENPQKARLYLYIQAVLSFVLKSDKPIRVRGQEISKDKALEEYRKLDAGMIKAVAENYSKCQSKVKDMFAYIASCLYQMPQVVELRKSGCVSKPTSYDLEFFDKHSAADSDMQKGIIDQWLLNGGLSDLISEEEKIGKPILFHALHGTRELSSSKSISKKEE